MTQIVSSTSIKAELLSGNSSYIISSLTIRISLEANLSTITCNRIQKTLILPNCEFPSFYLIYFLDLVSWDLATQIAKFGCEISIGPGWLKINAYEYP